jgi:hypothetical protein
MIGLRKKNSRKNKINESKSIQVMFSPKNLDSPPVTLNNQTIPTENLDKYLGPTIDKRLI